MKLIIDYWTCGDTLIEGREIEADSIEEAIAILADDEQAPLGQVKSVRKNEQKTLREKGEDDDTRQGKHKTLEGVRHETTLLF